MTHRLEQGFSWQDDYGVLSVSEKDVPRVIEYIKNQTQHHTRGTLWKEYEEVGQEG
jgi:putative transposase